MAKTNKNPIIIVITLPGTLIRPIPNLRKPIIKMEIITPKIFPFPPVIATPPSTTVVIISSSQPLAIFGRVLPIREVSRIDANPEQRPVTVKMIRLFYLQVFLKNLRQ